MMGFDLTQLADAVTRVGKVVRVVITDARGSTPRDQGVCMLVWADGQSGTIGGGQLEYQAVADARALLAEPGLWRRQTAKMPLGPALGQCCGGAVTLLAECFGAEEVRHLQDLATDQDILNRPVTSGLGPMACPKGLNQQKGWFQEMFSSPRQTVWIYGAGHVGRALVAVLPKAEFDITWIDTTAARFPDVMPADVTQLIAESPDKIVHYAPTTAAHLVLTYSHALDLELCHRILGHAFDWAGLIGSATKWARFRIRLVQLGHSPAQIGRITCPIGQPELGKAPESIAVGVAAQLLKRRAERVFSSENAKELAQ
jgi:xanthine dehydrogenase accessory factor